MKEQRFRRKQGGYLFLLGLLAAFLMHPIQAQASWTSGGPYGGDVNCLAMARSNPDVIYAGTKTGVYKTVDGGDNWTKTGFADTGVRTIQVAPNYRYQTINFDDIDAPCSFTETTALKNQYGGIGVIFSGPGDKDGGAILDECSRFSPTGQSSPNFLALDQNALLSDGGVPSGPETILFDPPADYVKINAAWASGASIVAYDASGNLLDLDAVAPYGSFRPLSVAGTDIARVVIHFSGDTLLLDDLEFAVESTEQQPDVVYAGTDDGIYKSEDGGDTWALTGLSGASVDAIAVHPFNSGVVYAGTNGSTVAIYQSTDGGDTWQEKLSEELDEVAALLIDTDNPDHVYAGIRNSYRADNFCKSTNGGRTWECSRAGRISTPPVISLAMTPAGADPAAIYAVVENWDVHKSIDGGEHWVSVVASQIPNLYPNVVSVDPSNPDIVYLGTGYLKGTQNNLYNLYKSTDGAETWSPKPNGLPGGAPSDIMVDPRNSAVYIGFPEGGIYKSTDTAEDWHRLALNQTYIEGLALSPQAAGVGYAAVAGWGNHLAKTTDGGLTWDYLVDSPADLGAVAIDPGNLSTIFVGKTRHFGNFFYIYKSVDGGQTWADIRFLYVFPGTAKLGVSDIWLHPEDFNTILVAGADFGGLYEGAGGIYKTTDGGAHWHRTSNFWAAALAPDPNNSGILYYGSERMGYVFRSTDIGSSWTRISPGGEWVDAVRDIEVDANSRVYAATNEGLMIWDGSDWNKVPGLPTDDVTALAIDRDPVPEKIYLGTGNAGIFVSQNGGASWISFNPSFPNFSITKLRLSTTSPKMLYAGTGSGGVWQTSLSPPGDVNGDGGVGLKDAVLVLQSLSEKTGIEAVHVGADVDGDGKIGLKEGIYILQKTAGLRN